MSRAIRFRLALPAIALALALLPRAARADAPTLQALIGDPDRFKLSASVRVRYETLDGQPRAGFRPSDEQLAVRTTLFAEYDAGPFKIGGEIYDSRAYLAQPGSAISANEVNTLEPVQAYVSAAIKHPLGQGSQASVQLGRFILNLGSRRFIAADDYRNTTNGYTGLRADLRTQGGTTATFIYTLPQVRLPDDRPSVIDGRFALDRESFDLRLWGGLIARPRTIGGASAEIGYYRLQERDSPARPTRNRNLHTVSARILREPRAGAFDYEIEGAYQFGEVRGSLAATAPLLDVSAGFLHADTGFTFPGGAKLRFSVEFDYASGDGPGRGFGRFDTLFGMRRADFSPAGIFSAIARTNIRTPGFRVEVAPSKRLDAFATYRAMWLDEPGDAFASTGVRDPLGASGSFAAHQLEGRVRYWLVPTFLRAEVNAVWLAKGRFLHDAPNAPQTGDTHYLATAVTATF